jgi:hypothetical protein
MTLEELERLEKAATKGPWAVEQWVGRTVIAPMCAKYPHTQYICGASGVIDQVGGSADANAALIVAARNALPGLLRVVKTAQSFIRVRKEWDAFLDLPQDDEELAAALGDALDDAESALRTALEVLADQCQQNSISRTAHEPSSRNI